MYGEGIEGMALQMDCNRLMKGQLHLCNTHIDVNNVLTSSSILETLMSCTSLTMSDQMREVARVLCSRGWQLRTHVSSIYERMQHHTCYQKRDQALMQALRQRSVGPSVDT
jgi:hypothetical protein